MNSVIRSMMPVAVLGVCLLAAPVDAVAGKPGKGNKGGTPNENSVAVTGACKVDSDTARVCSTKSISNVVLWCGGTWVKHEDFGPGDVYEATVDCVNGQGDPVDGPISMVAVKSGSQKNAKHHPEGYQTIDGAPSGSGLFTTPGYCASDYSCEATDDVPAGDDPDVFVDDDPPGGDVPVDDGPPGVPIDEEPPNPVLF